MKRILLALTLLIFCITGYSQNGFIIDVNCPNIKNGDTAYLVSVNRGTYSSETAIVSNGKFQFKSNVYATTLRTLAIVENDQPIVQLEVVVDNNENFTVNINDGITISNSKNNDVWYSIMNYQNSKIQIAENYMKIVNDSTADLISRFKAQKAVDSLKTNIVDYSLQQLKSNIPSGISGMLLGMYHDMMPAKMLDEIMEQMSKTMPDDYYYKEIAKQRQKEAETAVGQQFKEISMVDINGNICKLSDIVKKNKLVLLDFWASWCRPCLAEAPNVKRVYEEFHSQGFEIYGVSLDENMVSWQNAIERFGLNWIHVSDLGGWKSSAVSDYSIKGIPAMLLIDNSGKIVAKNLRGQALYDTVKSLLK